MSQKIKCSRCDALILQTTAERNDGLCMPCKNGTRDSIEAAKNYREFEKTDPFNLLFKSLVKRISEGGLSSLTRNEKTFYIVSSLISDVYRGALQLCYDVFTPDELKYVEAGLEELGVTEPISILREAEPLVREDEDWLMKNYVDDDSAPPNEQKLDKLTKRFLEHADDIYERLDKFAIENNLISVKNGVSKPGKI